MIRPASSGSTLGARPAGDQSNFRMSSFHENNCFALRSKEACAVEACPKGGRRGRRSTSEEPESRREGVEPEFRNDAVEPEFKSEAAEPESRSQEAEQSGPKNKLQVAGRRSTDLSDVGTSALSIGKYNEYIRYSKINQTKIIT